MTRKLLLAFAFILPFSNSFAQCTASIAGSVTGCQWTTNNWVYATPGGVSYDWYIQGTYYTTTTTDSVLLYTPTPGVQPWEVVIDFGSCVDTSAPVNMTVIPEPSVTASSNSPVCQGMSIILTATPVTGGTYSWAGPAGFNNSLQNPTVQNAQVANSGWYYVAVNVNGCAGFDSVHVVVNDTPSAPVVSNSGPGCSGGNISFSATTTYIQCGVTYTWFGPNSYTSIQQNPTITNVIPQTSGNYWCQVTTCNGCTSAPGYTTLAVNQTPNITTTYIDPTTLNTTDGSITISGVVSGSSYIVNYTKNGFPQPAMTQVASNSSIVLVNLGVGTYTDITVTWNGCTSSPAGPIVLTATMIVSDSVWPGDVNYDLLADNNDVLDLGLAYGNTGTARTGASNNWVAQQSTDWGTMQVCNYDMKHADCNGDGTVDANDTTAIALNYGQVHLKGEHVPQAKSASSPDLYFDLTGINFTAGTTVSVPIKLGTSSFPMNNIMGIAANVHISNISLNNAPTIDATTSWMGNSSNLLNFTKEVNNNQTDWTLVRTDHSNVSGDGTIATLTMDIPTGVQGQDVVLYMDDVRMIDNGGTEITNYNVVDDTATVLNVTISALPSNSARIVPNPSGATATLSLQQEKASQLHITVTDVTGRTIWSSEQKVTAGLSNVALPSAELAQGTYFVKISGESGAVNLKWQKK